MTTKTRKGIMYIKPASSPRIKTQTFLADSVRQGDHVGTGSCRDIVRDIPLRLD